MLEIDRLEKRFGDTRAVDGVSLRIPAGQMVGIIGRSGAGKSTLLRLVNRLIEPSAGDVRSDGMGITALRGRALREWRRDCAMIFQQFNLVGRLDVISNVLIGRVSYHRAIPAMLKRFTPSERALAVEALDRLEMLPQAFQRAETLSGGQQQRVAIARALVQNPKLVLADEPIASLDPVNAVKVMEALRAINSEQGITVICNLHTLDTARTYCDRIIGMADGEIVFDGTAAELTHDAVDAIYGAQGNGARVNESATSTSLRPEPAGVPQPAVA